jgi:hypothetical protein
LQRLRSRFSELRTPAHKRRWVMREESTRLPERVALCARYLIIAGFAMVFSVMMWGAKDDRAHASSPVAAAPSVISFTAKINRDSKFYITDTSRKIICVYSLVGDKLRLVSARKYNHDSQILDSNLPGAITIEGGNGITAEQAEQYVKQAKPELDRVADKWKVHSIGGQNFGGQKP